MEKFDFGSAVGAGFRLIGREPAAVAIWLGGYLVVAAGSYGLMFLAAPDFFAQYVAVLRSVTTRPDTVAAANLTASMGRVWLLMPVLALVGLVVSATLLGAIYRAVLQPDARRAAYLRFGRQELWLLLSFIAWVIVSVLVYMVVIVVASLLGGVVMAGAGVSGSGGAAILGFLFVAVAIVAAVLLVLWIVMRLSVGLPLSFDQSRFALFDGWRVTRGQGWKVLLLAFTLLMIMLGLELCALIVMGIVGGVTSLAGGGGTGVFLLIWAVLAAIIGMAFFVILAAPSADLYRQLKGEDLSVFS